MPETANLHTPPAQRLAEVRLPFLEFSLAGVTR